MSLVTERHELIVQWIDEAAQEIKIGIQSSLDIEQKTGKNDLVTNLDKLTERNIIQKIREHYPNDFIVSEEGYGDKIENLKGTVWFVDPIDGTLNFIKQQKNYAIMLAVYEDGVGIQSYIYNVENGKFYYAIKGKGAFLNHSPLPLIKNVSVEEGLLGCNSVLVTRNNNLVFKELIQSSLGIRMIGSAGLEAMEVATSSIVAYIASSLKPWDIAPGKVIVEELGGVVTRIDGQDIDFLSPTPTLIANITAHKEIQKKLTDK